MAMNLLQKNYFYFPSRSVETKTRVYGEKYLQNNERIIWYDANTK